ncbi:Rha family transcriptional regulator [Acinetobacter johnsonii]|uniref:Rha family transcriptional regulator n=1 Tax=Acinetobacter johnsonii TaxID=40214 RepID=UPI001F15A831|nr:phage regulatory protein/antirepressor Ant [Acinetobacter johnsonii]UIP93966.1 phage regulatory protein/antirepressor Ant [Acinetobacter johnsonii]
MITQFQENQKTMSSREIAELCEKEHFHVKRDCEVVFRGLNLDASKFGCTYLDSMNREQTEYLLDEELTMTLITGYSILLRNRVIKRWKELEDKASKPVELSRMDLIQLALAAEQENQALKNHVAVLEPKAQVMDVIADTVNTYSIRDSAKTIGIQESKLIDFMLKKHWVYRENSRHRRLCAYAQRVEQKVMVNKVSQVIACVEGDKVYTQARITAYGLTRLTALVAAAGLLKK